MVLLCDADRILDYIIEPVSIALPLLRPNTTRLTHVACGRAHTVIATDSEGGTLYSCVRSSMLHGSDTWPVRKVNEMAWFGVLLPV